MVVICSDTESVNGSKLVRNGLTALRYLKPGKLTTPAASIAIVEIIIEVRTMKQFLISLDLSLNFLMISHMITYRVANPTINPRSPNVKEMVRSNNKEKIMTEAEKSGLVRMKGLFSFFKNGIIK